MWSGVLGNCSIRVRHDGERPGFQCVPHVVWHHQAVGFCVGRTEICHIRHHTRTKRDWKEAEGFELSLVDPSAGGDAPTGVFDLTRGPVLISLPKGGCIFFDLGCDTESVAVDIPRHLDLPVIFRQNLGRVSEISEMQWQKRRHEAPRREQSRFYHRHLIFQARGPVREVMVVRSRRDRRLAVRRAWGGGWGEAEARGWLQGRLDVIENLSEDYVIHWVCARAGPDAPEGRASVVAA